MSAQVHRPAAATSAAAPRARVVWHEGAAGAAAGVAGTLLGFPLDTVKAQLQTGRSVGAMACVRTIARTEGLRGFYRGVASPLISMTMLNTLCFETYSHTRALVGLPPVQAPGAVAGPPAGSFAQRFAAGALVAPLIAVVSTPFELVKVQLQIDMRAPAAAGSGAAAPAARRFAGALHAARTIAQQRGVLALWCGTRVNLVREGLFLGTYFVAYEGTKDALITSGVRPSAAVAVAGGAWPPVACDVQRMPPAMAADAAGPRRARRLQRCMRVGDLFPTRFAQKQSAGAARGGDGHAAAAAHARHCRGGARARTHGRNAAQRRCAGRATAARAEAMARCGVRRCYLQMWRSTGVRGLFRGVLPSVLRAFLVSGSRFSAYESALEMLRSD
jgi:hypothetical protein